MNLPEGLHRQGRPVSPGLGPLLRKPRRDITDRAELRVAARKFIERFGDQAPFQAARRAEELLSFGDYQGRTLWQLIYREVNKQLKNLRISGGENNSED